MAVSIFFDTFLTTNLMLGLSGETMISKDLSLRLRHFFTRLAVFFVHVALRANTLAFGNNDRSSPTCPNHFLNGSLPSSLCPLYNTTHITQNVIFYKDVFYLIKIWCYIDLLALNSLNIYFMITSFIQY